MILLLSPFSFFFFNDTATTEIYTLSLHDALPILIVSGASVRVDGTVEGDLIAFSGTLTVTRSEEHTSELQSHLNLVCRLLLEKKKKNKQIAAINLETGDTTAEELRPWLHGNTYVR